jgi:hypothetical protein
MKQSPEASHETTVARIIPVNNSRQRHFMKQPETFARGISVNSVFENNTLLRWAMAPTAR